MLPWPIVYPSGADFAIAARPTEPPAPVRFSMMIGCPSAALISAPTMRLVTSGPLPGPQGTMKRIGLIGYSAAQTDSAQQKRTVESSNRLTRTIPPPMKGDPPTTLQASCDNRQVNKEGAYQ